MATLSLACTMGAGILTTPASADIAQQIRQSQAQLDRLNTQAEKAAEHYNAGRIALVRARYRAGVAQAAASRLDGTVAALHKQAGAFAAQVYRSGSGSGMDLSTWTSAAGPATFLDRAATLERISRRNADILGQLATARHRQAQATAEADAALADAAKTVKGLEADKQAVLRSSQQVQTVLAALQARQAELIRAAADAAARKAAQARAAELARQAALNAAATVSFRDAGSALSTVSRPTRHYSGSAAHIAVQVAHDQLGKPYTWGAAGPDTFDCSGLTMYAYGKAGISLPHYTGDQWNAGRHVSQGELVPGDLVFFGQDLGHVGMYIGSGEFIHAPHSGDVVKVSSLSGYYQQNYAGAVRVAG